MAEAADPVIPDAELARSDPELHRKLTAAGCSEHEAKGVGATLGRAAAKVRRCRLTLSNPR